MKSPSSSSLVAPAAGGTRDSVLTSFCGTVVAAARTTWGDRIIAEGNGTFDPRQLYTETHYALAAVLLYLQERRDVSLLDVAEARLRLWGTGTYPLTFFNAMAISLTAIASKQAGVDHPGLAAVLERLLSETREHRHVAYTQYCGNNAYLQQVAVDTVLLPTARGQAVTAGHLKLLVDEFRKFRTPEGFFFDLPRNGRDHERLMPPTYVMKMLFLLGVCHELCGAPELGELFRSGMVAARPLIAHDGNFSYLGRTDNSPFAAGLTVFNLRKAAQVDPALAFEYEGICAATERFYLTFPRTTTGLLESNRFTDAASPAESWRSKDAYAYVAQYSLASCAYAMLGVSWFPAALESTGRAAARAPVVSRDLGVVKIPGEHGELLLRTRSEMTSWDRRYVGPTVLRFTRDERRLVGAICRTVATDRSVRAAPAGNRLHRVLDLFRERYVNGSEQLDATSVGYVPVLRAGAVDYVPYTASALEIVGSAVVTRHPMVRVNVRGLHPCVLEAAQLLRGAVPGMKRQPYVAPRIRNAGSIELIRKVTLEGAVCRIDDQIEGAAANMTLLFSVRRLEGASVTVHGLAARGSIIGWSSDGRQTLDLYEGNTAYSPIRYSCAIGAVR